MGLMLAAVLGLGLRFGARLFTSDADVLHMISIGIPVSPFSATKKRKLLLPLCSTLDNPGVSK